ncbi:MAG: hypothetical protein K6E40_03685 [Desulfovibrio sp.]|nr:hypothetical protein [Desulfovibrio sp.]
MSTSIDVTGQRFGRLTAIERDHQDAHNRWFWRCKCDCGNETAVMIGNLRGGQVKSCGCLQREASRTRLTTHGQTDSRLHRIWRGMKGRCLNPNYSCFEHYGGRGISVCPEWRASFQAFHDWAMSHGYSDDLTIDRADNNGNYEPSNCRWVSRKEQSENTRRTRLVEFQGEVHSVAEWARRLGFAKRTLARRLDRLPVAEAFAMEAL